MQDIRVGKTRAAGSYSHLRLCGCTPFGSGSAPRAEFSNGSVLATSTRAPSTFRLSTLTYSCPCICFFFVMYTFIDMRLPNRRCFGRKTPLHLKVWACTRRCGSVNVFNLTPVCLDAGSCALLGEQLSPPGCSSKIHLLDSQRRVSAPTCTLSLPPNRPHILPLSFTHSDTRPDCHKQAPPHMRSPIEWRSGMLGLQYCRPGVCVCVCVRVYARARAHGSVLKVPICVRHCSPITRVRPNRLDTTCVRQLSDPSDILVPILTSKSCLQASSI